MSHTRLCRYVCLQMHVFDYRQAAPVVCSMEALMPVSEFKIAGPALLLLNREGKSASCCLHVKYLLAG